MQKLNVLTVMICLLFASTAFAQKRKEKDNLNNKVYTVTMTEAKKGGKSGKPIKDELEFRSSKVKSKTVMDQFGFGQIKYELEKDSTYTMEAGDSETTYIEFVAEAKDKDENTVKMTGTVDGYGIEGSVELIDKKDKVKKHFDFVGAEKGPKHAPKTKKGDEESSGE